MQVLLKIYTKNKMHISQIHVFQVNCFMLQGKLKEFHPLFRLRDTNYSTRGIDVEPLWKIKYKGSSSISSLLIIRGNPGGTEVN